MLATVDDQRLGKGVNEIDLHGCRLCVGVDRVRGRTDAPACWQQEPCTLGGGILYVRAEPHDHQARHGLVAALVLPQWGPGGGDLAGACAARVCVFNMALCM